MDVTLTTNPSSIQAHMHVCGAGSDHANVLIIDMNGKMLFDYAHAPNNEHTLIGIRLLSPMYVLKVIDRDVIKIIKFVKL